MRSPNIFFDELKAAKLPYENKTFDVVTSFQVVEHIKTNGVSIFLSEIKRILNNGGIVLFTTPNRKIRLYPF
ncbi:methyltransferase domain-containing protein [Thermodesulfobacteriota bacterium]